MTRASNRSAENVVVTIDPPSASSSFVDRIDTVTAESNVNILDVLNVVSWHRSNAARVRLLRVSSIIVKFLLALNVLYTLAASVIVVMITADRNSHDGQQHRHNDHHREAVRNKLFILGVSVCTLAPLVILIDLMALKGLKQWRRQYLLPWLLFYGFITGFMFFNAFNGLLVEGNSVYAIILVCSICFMSAWKQVRRQYSGMGHESNAPVARTLEELAQDLRRTQSNSNRQQRGVEGAADPPPKYDDLEQPPVYSEAVRQNNNSSSSSSTVASNANSNDTNEVESTNNSAVQK